WFRWSRASTPSSRPTCPSTTGRSRRRSCRAAIRSRRKQIAWQAMWKQGEGARMADDRNGDDTFLRRWSRRKHAAARETAPVAVAPAEAVAPLPQPVAEAGALQEMKPPVSGEKHAGDTTELPSL